VADPINVTNHRDDAGCTSWRCTADHTLKWLEFYGNTQNAASMPPAENVMVSGIVGTSLLPHKVALEACI